MSQETQQTAGKPGKNTLKKWYWSKPRELAAKLCAEDDLNDDQIAHKCDISTRQLRSWRKRQEFQGRMGEHLARFHKEVLSRGFCVAANRLKVREMLINDLLTVKKERAQRPEMLSERLVDPKDPSKGKVKVVAGGQTGLVCLQPKMIGEKEFVEQVLDTALANEIRIGLKEIAQEVGQWAEKHELGAVGGGPIVVQMSAADAKL